MNQYQTAQVYWSRVDHEYTIKSIYVQSRLEQAFSEMRCSKGGDVKVFVTSVRCSRSPDNYQGLSTYRPAWHQGGT